MIVVMMSNEDIKEVRRMNLAESTVYNMIHGRRITEREKEIVNKRGKVYVEAHKRDGDWVKPQLRDLPKDVRRNKLSTNEIKIGIIRKANKFIDLKIPEGYYEIDVATEDAGRTLHAMKLHNMTATNEYYKLERKIEKMESVMEEVDIYG